MGNNTQAVKGFKVFNSDWTCRGFQYEVGKIYEMDGPPICCSKGFHFCLSAIDCFNYYAFDPENKVAEILAIGELSSDGNNAKSCTNKIKIVREIPWDEVLRIANTGKDCSGLGNTGNWNIGNWNTGNRNTGNGNAGDRNSGNCNTGSYNTGSYNTGSRNSGSYNTGSYNTRNGNTGNRNTGNGNSGDRNTGNRNTGDWNKSSFNTGCFMTEEQKIHMFNKPSGWSYRDWRCSDAQRILSLMPKKVVKWIHVGDMGGEEMAGHPEYETTGGCLKVIDGSGKRQAWWDALPDHEKNIIKSLPNFDPGIFEECTGIKVGGCKG